MLILDSTSVTKRGDISLFHFITKRSVEEYGIGCWKENGLVDRLLKLLNICSCYDIHRMKSNGDKVFFFSFLMAKYIFWSIEKIVNITETQKHKCKVSSTNSHLFKCSIEQIRYHQLSSKYSTRHFKQNVHHLCTGNEQVAKVLNKRRGDTSRKCSSVGSYQR